IVRGQTPAASATASGFCPLSTCRTIRSRPRGVSRAFLCMFIWFSPWNLKLQQPQLPRSEPDEQPNESSQLAHWLEPSRIPKPVPLFWPRDRRCLGAERSDTIIFGSIATRLRQPCPLETEQAPLGMSAHWKTIRVPSRFPGLISLPSEAGCSRGRYKISTKIFAPNSPGSDLHWSAQDSNHSFQRSVPR